MAEDTEPKDKAQQILAESKKRFQMCEEAERELRALALDDLKFRAGEQWPEEIKQRMMQERKPALTINVLPARERQILNEQRQNRSAILVSPVDDKADPDTADVLQGIIRHIEYDSDADVAFDTASASATRIGFGFMRLLTEYESPASFRQVIKIERIRNPFQVYLDPGSQKADGSDAKFGFIFETLTKEEFKQQYPQAELASLDDWKTIGAADPEWLSEDGIRIVEYFYEETTQDEVLLLRNPAGEEHEMLASDFAQLPASTQKLARIAKRRPTEVPVIRWCKHSAEEILDQEDWQGKWVPIIPVYGDELDVDGKRVLEGMVRHAKDPMRMQNYMASKEVQAIALAPNAPFIAAEGQVENHPEWGSANVENYSVLTYTPVQGEPRPERQVAEPPIQAISQARLQFADDLKAVTGIYDAQLGARSNEHSGRAIQQRKSQGELSNFHYADNLSRARKFLGRQLIDLIPKVMSTAQMIRTIGEDGAQKVVQVNQEFQQADGSTKKYDLTVGRYDVTVDSGPSYQTRRQAAVDSMLDMVHAFPPLAQSCGDLLVGAMDWPGHEKFAERLKKLLPPQLQDDGDGDPKAKVTQLQSQLQSISQQHEALTQALNQANEVIKTKQVETQGRLQVEQEKGQTQLAMERLKIEAQIAIAEINTKAQMQSDREQFTHDVWDRTHSDAHEFAMQKDQQAHTEDMAEQAAANAQTQQQTQIAADQSQQPETGAAQ